MAFSEAELAQHRQTMDAFIEKHRPPEHIRDQLDLGYRIENQSIVIFEIRPQWNNPQNTIEIPVAKTTWVKTHNTWRLYWMQRDLKWHRHPYIPEVSSLKEFADIVSADAHHLFFG